MLMAWGRLGGIGEFPPHPSRLRQCHLVPRLRLGTTEALPQPLRIRREFSNTSSPSSRHCINTVYHWFPVLHFFCQITMAKFAKIRYCTIPYICVIKVMEEVDNTSSTFISVFFTDIQEWLIPHLKALNVCFNLKYQTLQKLPGH